MAKKLSASLEDYLEAIAELCSKEGHAHSKEIAEKLSVKMPSVTEALRQLVEMGYISSPKDRVRLNNKTVQKRMAQGIGKGIVSYAKAEGWLEK